MATPSSKPNFGATPTYTASSPRPTGGGPIAKPLAHKSPSARTPTASGGHGQIHQPSTSSHQYSTPLAAAAGADDFAAFSSPSVLLALGGYTGITPSPAAHDGLIGAGMNENGMQALSMPALKLNAPRDNEEERRRHIEEVVQILRSRVAGRGVCREGIERLSRLEGFESIWQENSLNVAGNLVDLEIEFHPKPNADTVKDVRLTYVTPEACEGERREGATAVLKGDLIESPEEKSNGVWKELNGFHSNLQWLAKLDRLSREVNCFEAIEGLFASLRRIWDEEGKLSKFRGTYDHLCNGWVGRPYLHKEGRIGLALEYWVQQHRALDAIQNGMSEDAMMIDRGGYSPSETPESDLDIWAMKIECEEGYPSLRVSKDWVASDVLVLANTNETSPLASSSSLTDDSEVLIVNWAEPPLSVSYSNMNQPSSMAVHPGMQESTAPNLRFVVRLEPSLDVPILAASDIYRLVGAQLPQELRMVTYDGLLVPVPSLPSAGELPGIGFEEACRRRHRSLPVTFFDPEGKRHERKHFYTFQSFESLPGRTLCDIPFSHPRQLAEIIPILRQYACLETIVRKIFDPRTNSSEDRKSAGESTSQRLKNAPEFPAPGSFSASNGLITLSNRDPAEDKLDFFLNGSELSSASAGQTNNGLKLADGFIDGSASSTDNVKVDITLRTQLGQAPVLMLLFTTNEPNDHASLLSEESPEPTQVCIAFEIGLNARISVLDSTGLQHPETDSGGEMSAIHGLDGQKHAALELEKKIARVLETSHDIGVLVEWVLRWLRRRKG